MADAGDARQVLEKLRGRWAGRARLWFEPDALASDDVAEGVIEPVGMGRWVRHEYTTQISGATHAGSA